MIGLEGEFSGAQMERSRFQKCPESDVIEIQLRQRHHSGGPVLICRLLFSNPRKGSSIWSIYEFRNSLIQLRADGLERSGKSRAEAERCARIEFGGYANTEQSHEAQGNNFLERLVQDVRFSLRVLRKSPSFTIAAVLTLALAIGANAVVFSMFNSLVLRPLNVPESRSLYALQRGSNTYIVQSYPDYVDLRDRNKSFDTLAAFTIAQAGLDAPDPSTPWFYEVSGNYFDALRIQPYLGRLIHASDEHGANSAPYIVLGYSYWHTHFQDDAGVIGRKVRLNKHPFTIIGVRRRLKELGIRMALGAQRREVLRAALGRPLKCWRWAQRLDWC